MRFDLSDDQELLRETARRFLEREAPLSSIRQHAEAPEAFSRAVWAKAGELGWAALGALESVGGCSLSGRRGQDLAIVAEEIGRLVSPGLLLPSAVALFALERSETQLQRLGSGVVAGEAVVGWAFGEPGDCWDPEAFTTTVEVSDEEIRLQGSKAYVEGGAEACAFIVTARAPQGLAQVVVPASAASVTVSPSRSIDLVRRFAEVRFDGVRLTREGLLGELGRAGVDVERQLQLALLLQCAETNGAVQRAFEFTVEYMRDRYAFGRPIASYQALKHRLADMLVCIHSCMATTDAAIDAFDAQAPETPRLARIAKAYVASHATSILGDLVQMTGGIAVTWEHDLHLYKRRVAVNRAVLGTPERYRAQVHRLIAA